MYCSRRRPLTGVMPQAAIWQRPAGALLSHYEADNDIDCIARGTLVLLALFQGRGHLNDRVALC